MRIAIFYKVLVKGEVDTLVLTKLQMLIYLIVTITATDLDILIYPQPSWLLIVLESAFGDDSLVGIGEVLLCSTQL
jgi:hypothetical protein